MFFSSCIPNLQELEMTQTSTSIQRTTHCQQCRRTKHRDAQRGRISEAVCRVTEGGLKRLHIAVFHFSDLQRKQSSKNRKQSSSCRGLEREWRFGLMALFCDLIAAVITQWYLSKVIKVCALKRVFYCVEIISQEKKNRKKKIPPTKLLSLSFPLETIQPHFLEWPR